MSDRHPDHIDPTAELERLEREEAVDDEDSTWIRGAQYFANPAPRSTSIEDIGRSPRRAEFDRMQRHKRRFEQFI